MKRLILFVSLIICSVAAFSQQLKVVEPLRKDAMSTDAIKYSKTDYSGNKCALIRMGLVLPNAKFEGDVFHSEYKNGEWWIYMTNGAAYIKILSNDYLPLEYNFPETLKSSVTYIMTIEKPKGDPDPEMLTENFLVIKCQTPADAKIFINDEYVGRGEVSKYLPIYREHSYRVEAPLYHTEEGGVRLSADNTTVKTITLKPSFGYLEINTNPQGATIEINGEGYTQLTPLITQRLPSGVYTIKAFKEMYKEAMVQTTVEDGGTAKVQITLEPNFGEVVLSLADGDAEVYVDNDYKGRGGWQGKVSIGTHRIEIKKNKHRTYAKTIVAQQGKTVRESIAKLEPICGRMMVNTTPIGAKIMIDGRDYGTSPKVIQGLLIGEHKVTLSKEGCSTMQLTVNVEEGKTAECVADLPQGNKVNIQTDKAGDALYVDGRYIGTSPMEVTLSFGNHKVEAERGGKRVSRNINVTVRVSQTIKLVFAQQINGHEYVDLGLSVKWATCNVGASQPEEYGNYFAWGETSTKNSYTENNSRTSAKSMADISGNSSYDAARANWGGSWRLPTKREMEELKNRCTWTWTSQSGVNGYRVTGPNGNSIFLPAAGYCRGSSRNLVGERGYYWGSTPDESDTYGAYYLYFASGYHNVNRGYRDRGYPVRPVSDNVENTNYSRVNTYQNKQEISGNNTFTVKGVTFKMIAVEGGTYTMGATSEQGSDVYNNEKPAHKETVSDFMIGETEVTQELWQAVMGSNPSNFKGDLQRPVEQVSWNECQEFIKKLNQLTGQNFRLPTEAEWEYAARGGNRSKGYKYAGSNSVDAVAWYNGNSNRTTHPVKTKQPNELGIYDMSGNVWEWCQDKYSNDYNSPRDLGYRVLRGGGWGNSARFMRVSNRSNCGPGSRNDYDGLRLAL